MESVDLVFTPMNDVPFVESVYLVFTPMNDVPFVEFKYLAEGCTFCGVYVPCIYSHEVCNLQLHCRHKNDTYIKMDNGVSHYDASLIVWAQTQDSGSV